MDRFINTNGQGKIYDGEKITSHSSGFKPMREEPMLRNLSIALANRRALEEAISNMYRLLKELNDTQPVKEV